MPLFNKKPFSLLEPPKDLDPEEKVFQIRFTKEIFLDYQEYVKRLNLYRQRVWTCNVSGKSNLTFEEALVSEHQAMEKVQNLPTDLMSHVLRMTQYSTLGLFELVNKIYVSLQEDVFEGIELHAQKDGSEAPCKILKILDSGDTKLYEVGWIRQGKSKAVINTAVVKATDLIRRRAPVSRNILKLLIRDSTSHSTPWIIHEHLAKKYGIPMEPPNNIMYGEGLQKKGKKRHDCVTMEDGRKRSKKDEEHACVPIKYPIDDLLVSPAADDPALLKRPPLITDFGIPRNSVGDLLMVWDFCLSFGRVLNLYPFSLADLENAICHKENNVLIVEIHSALFRLLIEDDGDYFTAPQTNKRKSKLSSETWAEYLSFFLEKTKIEELSSNTGAVRRGYYGLIDTDIKLKILQQLVEEAITTDAIREKLSERVEQQQALVATKREIARKEKEEKNKNMKNENNDVEQDGNECADEQGKGKEESDKRGISTSKTERKLHLVRHLETERAKLSIRASPLGKDRHYNRYWFFKREGRLFVESADCKEWGYYSTKEELDVLMGSLNVKGIRERALKLQLDKFYNSISNALEKRLKEITHKTSLEEAVLRRSTRVRAQPRDSPSMAFLKYVNKWNEH